MNKLIIILATIATILLISSSCQDIDVDYYIISNGREKWIVETFYVRNDSGIEFFDKNNQRIVLMGNIKIITVHKKQKKVDK